MSKKETVSFLSFDDALVIMDILPNKLAALSNVLLDDHGKAREIDMEVASGLAYFIEDIQKDVIKVQKDYFWAKVYHLRPEGEGVAND